MKALGLADGASDGVRSRSSARVRAVPSISCSTVRAAAARPARRAAVSLSHEGDFATAVVVASKRHAP